MLFKYIKYAVGISTLLFCLSTTLVQASKDKKTLTLDEFSLWRSVHASLSDHGDWYSVTYRLNKPNRSGDKDSAEDQSQYGKDAMTDVLYIRQAKGNKEYAIPRGGREQFSGNSQWVAYKIPAKGEQAGQIQLRHLKTGKVIHWKSDARYSFSEASKYFFLKTETGLLIHSLTDSKSEQYLSHIGEYRLNKSEDLMVYSIKMKEKLGNGLYLLNLKTGQRQPLETGAATYSDFSFNKKQDAIVMIKSSPSAKGSKLKEKSVLLIKKLQSSNPVIKEYKAEESLGFPKESVIAEYSDIRWHKDGKRLLLRREKQKSLSKDKTIVNSKPQKIDIAKDGEQAVDATVDVWHWKDDVLQSQQMILARRYEGYAASYEVILNLNNKRFVVLTDKTVPMLEGEDIYNELWALAIKPNVSDWDVARYDYYRVNLNSGKRELILKSQKTSRMKMSPKGDYSIYWRDGHYYAYDIAKNKHRNITEKTAVSFMDQDYDYPTVKPSYGFVGWAENGRSVILKHRYDLWLQPLNGQPGKNLTQGYGDKHQIKFDLPLGRSFFREATDEFIDLSKPMILSAFGKKTKDSGFFQLKGKVLKKLIYKAKKIGNLVRAKYADTLLYSEESFQQYPDYYLSNTAFSKSKKITNSNPQESEYQWGRRILIDYTNNDGVALQGVLSIPEDYIKGQKRPMIVTSYAKQSDRFHNYPRTTLRGSSVVSELLYLNDGYLHLQADIHYRTRTTHSDMQECIEAAIQKVVELGYVDEKRMGYAGHSFGGHAAMYMSTQKNKFAAIAGGAGVSNMIQGFNIDITKDGSGEQEYYMISQGRIGVSPSDDLDLYIKESPIFHAKNMNTPLLLLHGTKDPVVGWEHSFGFYHLLRFHKKPVIFLSYRGEGHGLNQEGNKKDFHLRLKAFFDHYLKDKPAPDWITKGIPFKIKKGSDRDKQRNEKPWL